jgi:hypothetical protein
MAFCLEGMLLRVQSLGAGQSCAGQLCDGLHGIGSCPRVAATLRSRCVLSVTIVVPDLAYRSLTMQPYQSSRMTKLLIGLEEFEASHV